MLKRNYELVRGSEDDLSEIHELTRQQYGSETLAHPDYWRWATRGNPRGAASSWLATYGGEIIAAVMMQPLAVKVGDREVLAYVTFNWVVRADFRGQGVMSTLVPWVGQDCANMGASFFFSAVGGHLDGLWRRVGLEVIGPASPLMVRPLDLGAILSHRGIRGSAIHRLAQVGYEMAAPLLRRPRSNWRDSDIVLSEVRTFDARFDHFWGRVKAKYHTLVVRDASFLQWRYRDVPPQGCALSGSD